jgi:nucleoside-diphosphate-sugar epimerase
VDRRLIPVVPRLQRLRFQAVHAMDVGAAYHLAVVTETASGAFNIAADPVLDPDVLGRLLGARPVPVPERVLRAAADLTWRARLQPTPSGWLDMALGVPLMSTTRASEHLGWTPRHTSTAALGELLKGMREGAGYSTPPLDPNSSGFLRLREFLGGVGARSA